jgi:hypothetical protein
MTNKLILRTLAVWLTSLLAAVCLLGQDHQSLAGKWSMTSETDSDSVKWTLVLKETDGQLSAVLSSDEGELPAQDFKYADGVIKFQAPYQGEYYLIELKMVEGKLNGTWSGGGSSGKTTGIKS